MGTKLVTVGWSVNVVWSLIVAFAAGSGGCGYHPGSFSHQVERVRSTRITVGCVDAVVTAYPGTGLLGPAAEVRLGNRCDAAVPVDLGRPAMLRFADGGWVRVRARDPRAEIRPLLLDARITGREFLEYELPIVGHRRAVQLCLDLSGLDLAAPPAVPVMICIPAAGKVQS